MSAISCSRSFCRSSSAFRSSSRLGARRPHRCLWCRLHMVTSFLCPIEKRGQVVPELRKSGAPGREQLVALVRKRVGALRRAWQLGAPLGGHEALVFKRAQGPVEVADVDALVTRQLGQPFDELVAVRRPSREERKERRLAEAFDPCPDLPAALAERSVPGALASAAMVHAGSICKLHMSLTSTRASLADRSVIARIRRRIHSGGGSSVRVVR